MGTLAAGGWGRRGSARARAMLGWSQIQITLPAKRCSPRREPCAKDPQHCHDAKYRQGWELKDRWRRDGDVVTITASTHSTCWDAWRLRAGGQKLRCVGLRIAPSCCQQSNSLALRLIPCRRDPVAQLRELRTLGIYNSGCEHDGRKLSFDPVSVQAMATQPAAIRACLAQ